MCKKWTKKSCKVFTVDYLLSLFFLGFPTSQNTSGTNKEIIKCISCPFVCLTVKTIFHRKSCRLKINTKY